MSSDVVLIPDHWRPEVEICIEDQCFSDGARNEVVRTLADQLFSKATKPTRAQCDSMARKLILKYPFAKDKLGNGYVSYAETCDDYLLLALIADDLG